MHGKKWKKVLAVPLTTPAKKKSISATIRIGQEIGCLPYAGFSLNQPHWANSSYYKQFVDFILD